MSSCTTSCSTPNEAANLADDARHAAALGRMREQLDAWMEETDDPLRHGDLQPPPGAEVNDPDQISPSEPLTVVGAA